MSRERRHHIKSVNAGTRPGEQNTTREPHRHAPLTHGPSGTSRERPFSLSTTSQHRAVFAVLSTNSSPIAPDESHDQLTAHRQHHMSWDYSFSYTSGPFDKASTELHAQLPPLPHHQSPFSSVSSEATHRNSMATDFSESEMESKLLPHNLWGDSKNLSSATAHARNANTTEEQRFLQSQLNGTDLWYSSDFTQPQQAPASALDSSSSSSSVFDMKVTNAHVLPHQRTQSSTPVSSSSQTPMAHFNMMSALQSLSGPATPQLPMQQQQPSQPQQQLFQPQLQQPFVQSAPQVTPAQLLNNTQSMLQSYQQQQVCLEQLQQQQAQLLQNPLFLQQQAQLVSQQLQQLQLQLQIQQQQIESLNAKKLEADKLPLTEENLTKLQQSPTEKHPNPAKSSHSSDNKSTVNTELYKTELCTTFQKSGACPYGNKCQFAHGREELKVVERGSKWRSKPCANWSKTGSCRYGNRCCFKHE